MEQINISTASGVSQVIVGEKWTNVLRYIPTDNVVIITDDNVKRIYQKGFPPFPVLSVRPGETSKSIETIGNLAAGLLENGIDRSGFILAIGGGVVCDIAGFLASVYMRGLRFGFISTSLLSQVDASVGGKNAVNLGNAKNTLGTFTQPGFVLCDPEMLSTLPEDEYVSGLAELDKMGFILDADLVNDIDKHSDLIIARDNVLMNRLISRSVRLKAAVVNEDEKETGKRMILNFGHTFGHIIETSCGLKHGYAVASGMEIAAGISVLKNFLDHEGKERLTGLLSKFGLLGEYSIGNDTLTRMLTSDKKKRKDEVGFVYLDRIGNAFTEMTGIKDLMGMYVNLTGRR